MLDYAICHIFGGEHTCIDTNHESLGMRLLLICILSSLSVCRLYVLLHIMSRLSTYCVIVIACVIIVYSVHPPCVGSTHGNLCRGVTGHTHWVGGLCEDGACCVLYHHHSTTPLKSWCPMLRNERSGSVIS